MTSTDPPLLERDEVLAQLRARIGTLTAPAGGTGAAAGACVLLAGAAGIGKTSVLQALRRITAGQASWLWGSCEPLLAPPALAPWFEMLDQLPARVAAAVRAGQVGAELYAGMLAMMGTARRPIVLVIEDVQWADGATLDLLRYLGRRVASTRTMLVLTWREDEVGPTHPVQAVLSGLHGDAVLRPLLRPLSAAAVALLAQRAGRSSKGLYQSTQGNPFFVTQLLAAVPGAATALPLAVRDAMLARLVRLPARARRILDLASLSPVALEREVLLDLGAADETAWTQAMRCELVVQPRTGHTEGSLRFVHELARLAVASALGDRAGALHGELFDALQRRGAAAARLVHHAEHGARVDAVLALVPQAAREAAAASAHRQAAALYALALSHRTGMDAANELSICELHADECLLTNQLEAARNSRERALTLAQALGDELAQARQRRVIARIHWLRGEPSEGMPLARTAIEQLERVAPGGRELAMAHATLAQLHLLATDPRTAREGADTALAIFERLGDAEGRAYALNTAGAARLGSDDEAEGLALLHQALAMALAQGLEELAARAYTNLASAAIVGHRLSELERWCDEGITYCEERDLDTFAIHLATRRAVCALQRGARDEALKQLGLLLSRTDLSPLQRDQIEHWMALLQVRRGGGQGYWGVLQAHGTYRAEPSHVLRLWYFDADLHRIESLWLRGDDARAAELARSVLASRTPDRRRLSMFRVWQQRCGDAPVGACTEAATLEPACTLELGGRHRDAADAWAALGCPYEQALALACGGEADQREALERLQALGAQAAAQRVRRQLAHLGAKAIARGPYRHARRDPLGLTAREREVAELIVLGLSNREIAARLVRSERTVEKHVAALISKLGVADRHEAASLVRGG